MDNFDQGSNQTCAIYVDLGTTNTRVWLMRGREILTQASKQVGVRDSARAGTTTAIRATLKELIATVQQQGNDISESGSPVCVVAAGMIGSPLGLAEVAHLKAPAGMRELSIATSALAFPEVTPLPFLIVPGVRSGSLAAGSGALAETDVMRGEETLCVGLHTLGLVDPPAVVLSLGSHWKAIGLSASGQIQGSVTSLSGEMIDAVRHQTILSSSLSNDWPGSFAPEWLEAGMQEQRRSGLPRALFCVRLLELKNEGSRSERFAYLAGAIIAADLDALAGRGLFAGDVPVVLSGHSAIAEAWSFALAQMSIRSSVVSADESERAFLAGLNQILMGAISISGSMKAQL